MEIHKLVIQFTAYSSNALPIWVAIVKDVISLRVVVDWLDNPVHV